MAVNDDITLTKGAFSVTLFTSDSSENFKNILQIIPGVTTPANQAGGTKVPTVVDLLRITHTFSIEAWIVPTAIKTAKQIKSDLINIFNGGGVNNASITLLYEDESHDVFFEDCVIKKVNNDNVVATGYDGLDNAEYHVTLTIVKGKLVGS